MHKFIESLQNPSIKRIALLQQKSRERRKTQRFVIEGKREISIALDSNYQLEQILFCADFINLDDAIFEKLSEEVERIEISKAVYEKLAYRNSTEGLLAVAYAKKHELTELKANLAKNPLILVAEAPEKPGNIGALLRTADAANLDAVIIANPKTDIYNPNTIRSSVGCVFSVPIATGSTSEIISFLQEQEISIYSAILQESEVYTKMDFQKPTAIVVGTEDIGLSQEWRDASTQNIHIPMQGKIDSMNVSVAAAILIFEAKRQRDF